MAMKLNVIEYPAKAVTIRIKNGAPQVVTNLINLKTAVEIEGRAKLGNRSLSAAQKLVGGESRIETLTRLQKRIAPHVELG